MELLFTNELERGDRKKAMARLKVPPFESQKTDWTTLLVGFALGCFLILLLVILASTLVVNNDQMELQVAR